MTFLSNGITHRNHHNTTKIGPIYTYPFHSPPLCDKCTQKGDCKKTALTLDIALCYPNTLHFITGMPYLFQILSNRAKAKRNDSTPSFRAFSSLCRFSVQCAYDSMCFPLSSFPWNIPQEDVTRGFPVHPRTSIRIPFRDRILHK